MPFCSNNTIFLVVLLLTACGGGGGEETATSDNSQSAPLSDSSDPTTSNPATENSPTANDGSFSFSDDLAWASDPNISQSGNAAYASVSITHSETTQMIYSGETESGELSFYYKVSSEANWDYLIFYVDGKEQLKVSGDIDWTQFSIQLSQGNHELKWVYSKDGSGSIGDDKVWIANIVLPGSTQITPGTNAAPDTIEILTGTLNIPIEGLAYRTTLEDDQVVAEGKTDTTGTFQYVEGYTVEFYIGGLLIHSLEGAENLNFLDDSLLVDTLPDIEETFFSDTKELISYQKLPSKIHSDFLNQIRLLFTLDEDMDPTNGIKILNQVSNLFSNSLSSYELRPKVFAAQVGPIIDEYNRIFISRELALYYVYRLFDITLYSDRDKQFVHSRITSESQDGFTIGPPQDGTPDATAQYQYNSFGQITFDSYSSLDGVDFEYNDYGYLIDRIPVTPDLPNIRYRYTYNSSGFETKYEQLQNHFQRFSYGDNSYDAEGNLISDIGEQNSDSAARYYTYNADGYLLTYNSTIDGFNRLQEHQYDSQNRRTYSRYTNSSGGDNRFEFDYDLQGNLVRTLSDRGTNSTEYNYTFNLDNQLINTHYSFWVLTKNTLQDTNHIYDNEGKLIKSETDLAYVFDGESLDGIIDTTTVYNYDVNGYRTSFHEENAFPRDSYSFDDKGRITEHRVDTNRDGIIERRDSYEYGAGEFFTEKREDLNNDGTADVIITRTFETSFWPIQQTQGHLDN